LRIDKREKAVDRQEEELSLWLPSGSLNPQSAFRIPQSKVQ